ncbi:hypothetical protein MNBD_GAMMA09-3633 [hydrothermal vent metagenome]|uniref:Uncharacterized protein n=1 Tax=hydrothermal vent metagenome TaxID=652676 RepID=A0A3B0YP52_9ZZZZ
MDCDNPKDKREEWACYAREYNGAQVVWIDQSTDTALKKANSKGVCFALTRDWVRSYRRYRIDRSKFVNSFRDAAEINPENRIPQIYITNQQLYAAQVAQNKRELEELMEELERRKKQGGPVPEGILATLASIRKRAYGRDLVNLTQYKLSEIYDISFILNQMKQEGLANPRYYMLTFRKKGVGGHVVGFEFRPDIHVSDNYPGLFEFIDANLGLYAFGDADKLLNFFDLRVWIELYGLKDYDSFELAEFDTGIGGLGKTWTETLNDLIAWFKSWVV